MTPLREWKDGVKKKKKKSSYRIFMITEHVFVCGKQKKKEDILKPQGKTNWSNSLKRKKQKATLKVSFFLGSVAF